MKFARILLVGRLLFFLAAWIGSHETSVCAATEKESSVGCECCDVTRVDDVWLISTRHLGCPNLDKASEIELRVEHYGGRSIGWTESTLDEFLGSSIPDQPTMVYVHGNRVSWNDAIDRAWHARNSILGCSHVGPIRYVIWSWPSDKAHGQVRDVRLKAARTNGEAHYLAWFLSQLDLATPLRMLGYSYGARVTTGALHVLGGGELAGQSQSLREGPRVRVALLAAAVHNDWLQPGACHEHALDQMDRLLIQYNSCDPMLQRYRFIEKHSRPAALGYTGMFVDERQGVWIEQRDVCCIVGKSHAEARYFNSTTLSDQIRETLFGG